MSGLASIAVSRAHRVRAGQFVNERVAKTRIVLHHTADGSPAGSVSWWNRDPDRVATPYIIDRDGTIYETFDPHCWAYHTGTGTAVDRPAVGIELTCWGWLKRVGGKYFNDRGGEVPASEVVQADWRGERYWHRYTDAQVEAVMRLVPALCDEFGIDRDVAPAVWDTRHADYARFKRFEGVITHAHVRADKTDFHPVFPWERLTAVVERRAPALR